MSLTVLEIGAIISRNDRRKALKAAASGGPWHVVNVDDDHAMNVWAVATDESIGNLDDMFTKEEARAVVAITLLQSPRFASAPEYEANAEFIASARNDDVESDVDALLAEVLRLRNAKPT